MPTIHTNDEQERLNYKARLAAKLSAQAVAPAPQERIYNLPSNYKELGDTGLRAALLHNPDWKYDVSTVQYVIDLLNGTQPTPDYVKFNVTEFCGDMPVPVKARKKSQPKRNVQLEEDEAKRVQFKATIAEKVATAKPVQPTEPVKLNVIVNVPRNFASLKVTELFGILTRQEGLSTDQANDVIALLNDKPQLNPDQQFTLVLGTPVRPEARPALAIKEETKRAISVVLPYDFDKLRTVDKFNWLRKEAGLSDNDANDAIDTLNGHSNLKTQFTFSYDTEPAPAEFAPRVKTPVPAKAVQTFEPVALPEGFSNLSGMDKYRFLTIEMALTPEHANHIINSQPVKAPEPVREELALAPRQISVPAGFSALKPFEKFAYLRTVNHLPPDDANDVIALLDGKAIKSGKEFSISFEEPTPEEHNPMADYQKPEATIPVYEKPGKVKQTFTIKPLEVRTIAVEFPRTVNTLRANEQYAYFTHVLGMIPEDANDLVLHLSGKTVNTVFEVEITEE